jgi:hypothetical protein
MMEALGDGDRGNDDRARGPCRDGDGGMGGMGGSGRKAQGCELKELLKGIKVSGNTQ